MQILYWDEVEQVQKERDATPYEMQAFAAARAPVPPSVSPAQARLALLAAGLLDQVQPLIDALPDGEREAAQIKWEFGATVDRYDPFTLALGKALGLTSEQIDELFIAASGM